jgi:hypothetical protein
MIIDNENKIRQSTQDDIIVYDRSLVPPVLVSKDGFDGVFLTNSVIGRIEVKSRVTRADIRAFVAASLEICELKVLAPSTAGPFQGTLSMLFAYGSDAEGTGDVNFQFKRVAQVMRENGCDPLSGKVSMICIPSHGFWKLGMSWGKLCWQRLVKNKPEDRVSWFVGCVSHTCFLTHAQRQGRDLSKSLEGGIGMYLRDDVYEVVPDPY